MFSPQAKEEKKEREKRLCRIKHPGLTEGVPDKGIKEQKDEDGRRDRAEWNSSSLAYPWFDQGELRSTQTTQLLPTATT